MINNSGVMTLGTTESHTLVLPRGIRTITRLRVASTGLLYVTISNIKYKGRFKGSGSGVLNSNNYDFQIGQNTQTAGEVDQHDFGRDIYEVLTNKEFTITLKSGDDASITICLEAYSGTEEGEISEVVD